MKEYGYDLSAMHSSVIFEKGTEAANGQMHVGTTPGIVVGASEWAWLSEDDARRICAALKYFSETTTEEIERLADERFAAAQGEKK